MIEKILEGNMLVGDFTKEMYIELVNYIIKESSDCIAFARNHSLDDEFFIRFGKLEYLKNVERTVEFYLINKGSL